MLFCMGGGQLYHHPPLLAYKASVHSSSIPLGAWLHKVQWESGWGSPYPAHTQRPWAHLRKGPTIPFWEHYSRRRGTSLCLPSFPLSLGTMATEKGCEGPQSKRCLDLMPHLLWPYGWIPRLVRPHQISETEQGCPVLYLDGRPLGEAVVVAQRQAGHLWTPLALGTPGGHHRSAGTFCKKLNKTKQHLPRAIAMRGLDGHLSRGPTSIGTPCWSVYVKWLKSRTAPWLWVEGGV